MNQEHLPLISTLPRDCFSANKGGGFVLVVKMKYGICVESKEEEGDYKQW